MHVMNRYRLFKSTVRTWYLKVQGIHMERAFISAGYFFKYRVFMGIAYL